MKGWDDDPLDMPLVLKDHLSGLLEPWEKRERLMIIDRRKFRDLLRKALQLEGHNLVTAEVGRWRKKPVWIVTISHLDKGVVQVYRAEFENRNLFSFYSDRTFNELVSRLLKTIGVD